MKLLVVSPMVPWPLDNGGRIRTFHLVRERAKRHEVCLVCLSSSTEVDVGPLRSICQELLLVPHRVPVALAVFDLLSGRGPFNSGRFRSERLARTLRDLCAREDFDELQIEFSLVWRAAEAVRASFKILSAHNVESDVTAALAETESNPLRRLAYRRETRLLRRFEAAAWHGCDACLTVSGQDRNEVVRSAGREQQVVVVPNGVDIDRFRPRESGIPRGNAVLLFGGLDYRPNRDAAAWFLDQVLPRLRELVNEPRVVVAGRGAATLAVARGHNRGVEMRGDVADARDAFGSAAVLAVPLRAGGGTRIKILEAMAAGLPVVASSKAAEGLEVSDGVELLIADGSEGFARALARVLQDQALARRMAVAARRRVEERYRWEKIVERMEIDLDRIRGQVQDRRDPRVTGLRRTEVS
jgi:glycosyltransferase involved in cell wall biosynthesis